MLPHHYFVVQNAGQESPSVDSWRSSQCNPRWSWVGSSQPGSCYCSGHFSGSQRCQTPEHWIVGEQQVYAKRINLVGADFELCDIGHDNGAFPHARCVPGLLLHWLLWSRDGHSARHLQEKLGHCGKTEQKSIDVHLISPTTLTPVQSWR